MSFFQDIPPPLDDDKSKDVDDYDLDDDDINIEGHREQSEIPNTDFDVYTSSSSIIKPPELSSALFFDTTPPDDDFEPSKEEVSHEDSFDEDPEFHLHTNNLSLDDENEKIEEEVIPTNLNTVESGYSTNSDELIKSDLSESLDQINPITHQIEENLEISTTDVKEIAHESENNVLTSFSASFAFDNDNDKNTEENDVNLHNTLDDIVNYPEVIAFNQENSPSQQLSEEKEEKINQDDDDFNDFETAIPVHRHTETQHSIPTPSQPSQEEVHFEADFSAFETFTKDTDLNDDDDDDFGDFNDFTQAPLTTTTIPPVKSEKHSIDIVKSTDLIGLLNTMFPFNKMCNEEEMENENLHNVMKSDDIVKKLDNFDDTLALAYLYNSSSASQILVKALGIDTRNILLGAQWTSSSNMPRFASNLSFNPLEPLKPISNTPSSSINSKSDLNDVKILAPQQPSKSTMSTLQPDVIPDVEFDWNSSGLVNPLDAHNNLLSNLLDLEHLKVAMVNSDKINSSLNFTPTTNTSSSSITNITTSSSTCTIDIACLHRDITNNINKNKINDNHNNENIDDVLRQFDLLNNTSSYAFAGTIHAINNKINSKHSSSDEVSTAVFKSTPISTSSSNTSPPPSSSITHAFENESTLSYKVDEEENSQSEVIESSIGSSGIDIDGISKFSSWQNEAFPAPLPPSSSSSASTSSILVRERTIKLPETHIFTPVKSTSPVSVSREVTDDSTSSIIVKEYHDIEYSLEPKRKNEIESDFDDFQSAPPPFPLPVISSSISILEPQKAVEKINSETISWPNPGNLVVEDDFSFMIDTKNKEEKKELPVIGNSPTKHAPLEDENEDDDFADFQAAPLPASILSTQHQQQTPSNSFLMDDISGKPKVEAKSEPLTLSPSKLVSDIKTQESSKPSWITCMDDDEIKRYEAAFPKCKVSPKPQQRQQQQSKDDDDDWTDFVGATTTNHQNQHQPSINNFNTAKPSTTATLSHQKSSDDWSDFVSAPSMPTVNSISSQILSKPNFTSWNQPISRPYVHHATSFLSSEPKSSSSSTRSGITITNNFNYHPHQNGISTILPDLDFAMPKHLINLPRSGSSSEASGKK